MHGADEVARDPGRRQGRAVESEIDGAVEDAERSGARWLMSALRADISLDVAWQSEQHGGQFRRIDGVATDIAVDHDRLAQIDSELAAHRCLRHSAGNVGER